MALPVESFEIEAQTPSVVAQEPSALRKATPVVLGASCLAALALVHTSGSGSAAVSPQASQELVAADHPAGPMPHITGVMDAARDAPHSFGTTRDEHGCIPTGGFVWCASQGECVQPWVHACADLSASMHEVAQSMPEVESGDAARRFGGASMHEVAQRMPEVASGDAARRFGGSRDGHGCLGSAGFLWCASAGECVQPWAQPCPSFQEQVQEALQEPAPEALQEQVQEAMQEQIDEGDDEMATPSQHARGYVPSVQALPDDLILQRPGVSVLGGTRDEHNCLGASGFTWCPSLAECVRGYSQSCPGGTETCQRLCAEEPAANDGLRFSCTCREGVALDHVAPEMQQ